MDTSARQTTMDGLRIMFLYELIKDTLLYSTASTNKTDINENGAANEAITPEKLQTREFKLWEPREPIFCNLQKQHNNADQERRETTSPVPDLTNLSNSGDRATQSIAISHSASQNLTPASHSPSQISPASSRTHSPFSVPSSTVSSQASSAPIQRPSTTSQVTSSSYQRPSTTSLLCSSSLQSPSASSKCSTSFFKIPSTFSQSSLSLIQRPSTSSQSSSSLIQSNQRPPLSSISVLSESSPSKFQQPKGFMIRKSSLPQSSSSLPSSPYRFSVLFPQTTTLLPPPSSFTSSLSSILSSEKRDKEENTCNSEASKSRSLIVNPSTFEEPEGKMRGIRKKLSSSFFSQPTSYTERYGTSFDTIHLTNANEFIEKFFMKTTEEDQNEIKRRNEELRRLAREAHEMKFRGKLGWETKERLQEIEREKLRHRR